MCHLVISRPDNFRYRPGDYIFLQIPAIAKFEWHPFTISSAPEMKGKHNKKKRVNCIGKNLIIHCEME